MEIRTKDLIFIALMGAAWFVLDYLIGQWINAVTGLFLIGAFLGSIIAGFFVVVMIKIRPKFWTFTLALLIFGLLAFPTGSSGPAGFWPKIIINALIGLIGDIFIKATRYKNWAIFVAFYILSAGLLYGLTFAMILMGVPEAGKTLSLMHFVVLGYWIIGSIGLWLGFRVYRKIKDKSLVRQISAS